MGRQRDGCRRLQSPAVDSRGDGVEAGDLFGRQRSVAGQRERMPKPLTSGGKAVGKSSAKRQVRNVGETMCQRSCPERSCSV